MSACSISAVSQPGWRRRATWSGRRDLNSRPSPWQGDALPLSYSRLLNRVYRAGQTGSNRPGLASMRTSNHSVQAAASAAAPTRFSTADDLAIPHMQDSVRDRRRLRIMRNHQRRLPSSRFERMQHLQHCVRVLRIQIAGRFVSQHNRRPRDQRPCNRHPLLFTARSIPKAGVATDQRSTEDRSDAPSRLYPSAPCVR